MDLSLRGRQPEAISIVGHASSLSIRMTGKMPVPPKMGLLRRFTPRNDKLGPAIATE